MAIVQIATRLWANLSLRAKGVAVVAIPVTALLIATLSTCGIAIQGRKAQLWVAHTLEVRTAIQDISTTLLDAQGAVQGYALTGREDWLLSLRMAHPTLQARLDRLRSLIQNNSEQTHRLRLVEPLINQQLGHFEAVRQSFRRSTVTRSPDALDPHLGSNAGMEAVRGGLDEMLHVEDVLLSMRKTNSQHIEAIFKVVVAASFATGLLGGVLAMLVFTWVARRIRRLEQNARHLATGTDTAPATHDGDEISSLEAALQETRELLQVSERKIREQFTILQCVLSSIADGVIVADTNGKFLMFNPAAERILGESSVDTTPDAWSDVYGVFLPDGTTPYPASDLPLARAIRGEDVDSADLFIRRRNWDQGIWISAAARPLRPDGGPVVGGVVVVRDVTSQRHAEQALFAAKQQAEASSRAKSEFLSRMSHELRTPLNSILGFTQVLQRGDLSDRALECSHHVLKAGRHLLGLIDEVLDIARIEAGKLALSVEPVDLLEAVSQALDIVQPLAMAQEIELFHDTALTRDQHVLADRLRFAAGPAESLVECRQVQPPKRHGPGLLRHHELQALANQGDRHWSGYLSGRPK